MMTKSSSTNLPEVSVLLCAYNAWPYVREAVDSVLSSENISLELVLVDDGSTDESKGYFASITDSRVKLISLDLNSGIAKAANIGIGHCRAPFIARFDADDIMPTGRLRAQVDYLLQNPEVGVVACTAELQSADFRQEGYQFYTKWTNSLLSHSDMYNRRFRDSPIVNPSVCLRAELYSKFGGYKSDVPEDYEFWMRLFEAGVRMEKLNEVGVLWRDHVHRLTRNHSDYEEEAFRAVKVDYFAREWKSLCNNRKLILWGKNRNAARWYEDLANLGIAVDAFVDFEVGTWKGKPMYDIPSGLQLMDAFYLIAVRNRKGHQLIVEALEEVGKFPGRDYYSL